MHLILHEYIHGRRDGSLRKAVYICVYSLSDNSRRLNEHRQRSFDPGLLYCVDREYAAATATAAASENHM